MRNLAGKEEGFDELAFAADSQVWETLEPLAVGNIGCGLQPVVKPLQLFAGDRTILNPFEKMRQEGRGRFRRRTLGIGVEQARDLGF